jgi:hypothetical protein
MRNEIVFKGEIVDYIKVVAQVKILSWGLFVNRVARHSGLFRVVGKIHFIIFNYEARTPTRTPDTTRTRRHR